MKLLQEKEDATSERKVKKKKSLLVYLLEIVFI